jgi:hypothetical protein
MYCRKDYSSFGPIIIAGPIVIGCGVFLLSTVVEIAVRYSSQKLPTLFFLTLSYSLEGSPALAGVKTLLTQNCLQLTIPGFPYNLLPISCGDIGFKKSLKS